MPTMLFRSLLRYAGYGQQTASRRRPGRQRPRARLSVEALEDRTLPSTFVVDRLTDTGAGKGLAGDLRYCLGQANANPGDDAITFSVKGTINLAGALPNLSSKIDIQGPGASILTVRRDTGGSYRIFTVDSGATVILSGLTITNGYVASNLGGGGIANVGTLTLNRATVSGNTVNESGGGIANFGTLTLNNSTVSGNSATDSGGGIYNGVSVYDTVTLNNSTVSGNSATYGGGIRNVGGTVTLNNATVIGNDAYAFGRDVYGGGIYNSGALALNNATVIGNYAYAFGAWDAGGGGIYNSGTVKLNNATVSGNYADGEVGDL